MVEGNLSEVRNEMLTALNSFLSHVKYTITLMTTMVAAAIAIQSLEQIKQIDQAVCFAISLLICLCLLPTAVWAKKICRRYYTLYVSNYIHCARLHRGVESNHPWVTDLFTNQGFTDETLQSENAVVIFRDGWFSNDKNSWHYYQKVIDGFYYLGIVGALLSFTAFALRLSGFLS